MITKITTLTTQLKPPTRGRIAAATMLVVGAVAAGVLGPAAPANAANNFVALAYQPSYEFEAKVVYGQAHGVGRSGVYDTARINALQDCEKNGGLTGGGQCEVRIVANHECAAVAAFRGTKTGDQGLRW